MKNSTRNGRRLPFIIIMLFLMSAGAVFAYTHDPEFDVLIAKKGAAARELFENPTLYREAQLRGMPCSPDDFQFLLDRPRTSVALAGKMHKSLDKYYISVVRPGLYHIEGGKELVGDMELVSDRPGKRLYYVTGYWKLIPGIRLNGRIALAVDYWEESGANRRALDARARGYMMVDNSVAGAAFKLAAFLFPKKVDARINRFATAVRKVVEGVHNDPQGTLKRLESVPYVPPEEAREFRDRFLAKRREL